MLRCGIKFIRQKHILFTTLVSYAAPVTYVKCQIRREHKSRR
jgi:hypothetical protein